MITRIAADGDYGRPATPGWRGRDWSAHERDALVAGRRLHYLDAGTGGRAFVLVHGMGGRWQHWLETIPTLTEHGRVLALDLPGFGLSESPAAKVSLDGFADAAAELVRELGVERVVVVGHSMGGPIALRFASRHPDLAEAIVPVGGAVFQFSALLGLHDVARFIAERPRESVAIAAEIATAGLPAPVAVRRRIASSPLLRRAVLAPYVLDPAALPADSAALIVDGAGAPGVLPTARAIGRSDPREGIEAVSCPILSIAADHDRIAPLPDTEAFQREVPRARTVVLEGCGHMAMLERPHAFNTQLLAYAQTLPASSPTPP
jgi:pimeloyl-ACP methyl ester carboxylesterase